MSHRPEISVVMSVFNSASTVAATIDSVLSQEGVDLELIIVDDGSTDETPDLLDAVASGQPRVRLVHQRNRGLTRSLIRGCESARGHFIARQDAGGDLSLPGRLAAQLRCLKKHSSVALVSSGARFVGPEGELLYEIVPENLDQTEGLRALDPKKVRGPAHHGTAMFRESDYSRAGGYREQFAVAQDLDLWLRLAETGRHFAIPDIAYEAKVTPGSISRIRRPQQVKTTRLILECARRRRTGEEEGPLLRRAARLRTRPPGQAGPLARSSALYFIASCLENQVPRSGRKYLWASLAVFPLNLKSWFRLIFGSA